MYIYRRRQKKASYTRCIRKNSKLAAKNRRRKLRTSGLPH